jgi:hypothetical protein
LEGDYFDTIGLLHVTFDELFMALASSEIQVGIGFLHGNLPLGVLDAIKGFSPQWTGPQKVTIDSNLVRIRFTDWVFTFAISKDTYVDDNDCLRFVYPCTYNDNHLVEKGDVVDCREFPTGVPVGAVSFSLNSIRLRNKRILIDISSTEHGYGMILVNMEDVYTIVSLVRNTKKD